MEIKLQSGKAIVLKPEYVKRMNLLLEEKDFEEYLESLKAGTPKYIRCNTLKITPTALKKRLEAKKWVIIQPFKNYPEIMIINSSLEPGELGRSLEHLLGYYYVQELASMLPVLALNPEPEETVLDLAASPGSKTTQIAACMKNTGTLIANDVSLGRIKILASNLERCGSANVIITKKEGSALCRTFKREGMMFDKILLDAPCSGEGTIKTSPRTSKMWNIHTVRKLSKIQKSILSAALEILKPNGTLVYSTCTHAPEENEEIIDFVVKNFQNVKIESLNLPIKCRPGLTKWNEKTYSNDAKKTCRIYPQDHDTEGFFIAKLRKLE